MLNEIHHFSSIDLLKSSAAYGKATRQTLKHSVCILLVIAFVGLTDSTRADVPPPPAKCDGEGAACEGFTIGLLGSEYKGTCVLSAQKRWYCKSSSTCYRAGGPGDADGSWPGYGERPCREITFAQVPIVASAKPSASVTPPIESKSAPSCSISITRRAEGIKIGWLMIAFFVAAVCRRRSLTTSSH